MHPYNFFVRGPNFTKTLQKFQKFGEVAPHSPKFIRAHMPNFKQNFEFWLSPQNFLGAPQFLNLNYKVPT